MARSFLLWLIRTGVGSVAIGGGGATLDGNELREDGSKELREDASTELRE